MTKIWSLLQHISSLEGEVGTKTASSHVLNRDAAGELAATVRSGSPSFRCLWFPSNLTRERDLIMTVATPVWASPGLSPAPWRAPGQARVMGSLMKL